MKYRGKRALGLEANLRLPIVFLLCFCFFLAGLFGSIILSQDVNRGESRHKLLQDSRYDVGGFVVQGASEESSIPFQVLSWRPRALYFPNFATDKQCLSIIEKAKSKLKPSSLALRKGETVESTKGVRQVLAHSSVHQKTLQELWNLLRIKLLEQLCYRGAMSFLRYSHITILQAFNVLRYEVEQRYVSHYDSFNPAELWPTEEPTGCFLLTIFN